MVQSPGYCFPGKVATIPNGSAENSTRFSMWASDDLSLVHMSALQR